VITNWLRQVARDIVEKVLDPGEDAGGVIQRDPLWRPKPDRTTIEVRHIQSSTLHRARLLSS